MASIDPTNPLTQDLQEVLAERRDDEDFVVSAYDAQAYDTVQLIKLAIEEAGSTDPEALQEAMNSISGYEAHFGQEGFTILPGRGSPLQSPTPGCAGSFELTDEHLGRPRDRWMSIAIVLLVCLGVAMLGMAIALALIT
jgi:hypothetical protein